MVQEGAPAGGIIDLNFACAAKLAAQGELQPQKLAGVFLPCDMRAFLDAGPGAMKTARETIAFCEQSGIRRGPNEETLVYDPAVVMLLAPLPNPASVRDFYAFEAHVKKGFEKRGEPMPAEWYQIPVYYRSGHHNIIGTGRTCPGPRSPRNSITNSSWPPSSERKAPTSPQPKRGNTSPVLP